MKQGIKSEHWRDDAGRPAGGCTYGVGFAISWQNGPLGRDESRKLPNGAFVEDVLEAVADRLREYQDSEFASDYNARALSGIAEAASALDERTKEREARKVEGTHSA